MYTGGNKIAIDSQNTFAKALISLMARKDFSKITVCELCEESGFSRQTFYGLFKTKENVLRYAISRASFLPEEIPPAEGKHLRDYLVEVLSKYVSTHFDFMRMLQRNRMLYVLHDCAVEWFMDSQLLYNVPQELRRYVAVFISSAFIGVTSTYIDEKTQPSLEELECLIRHLLEGSYMDTIL